MFVSKWKIVITGGLLAGLGFVTDPAYASKCSRVSAPAPPTKLVLVSIAQTSAAFSWHASSSSGVTNYLVSRNGVQIQSIPSTQLSFTNNALTASTAYTYTVRSQNSCGKVSSPSKSLQVTTRPTAIPTPTPTPTPASTLYNMWFWSDVAADAFAATRPPGVNIITSSGSSATPAILSNGIQAMAGIGGYAAWYAQGTNTNGLVGACPSCVTAIESGIDAKVAAGATWIYVDEPWPAPTDPGWSTWNQISIAYNVVGFNILWNYIHTNYPGVKFGLTVGDGSGAQLHLAMLRYAKTAGPGGTNLPFEDFASEEEYNSCCHTTNPFTTQKAEFPNVLTMGLFYGTESLCQDNGNYLGNNPTNHWFDIISTWDNDLYGNWIGPLMDLSQQAGIEYMAANNGSTAFCKLPWAWVDPSSWTWAVQTANFTFQPDDGPGVAGPYILDTTSCEYKVVSGPNAINGLGDPGNVITQDWTPRTCNAPITVTVGVRQNCRDSTAADGSGNPTCLTLIRNKAIGTGSMGTNPYGIQTYQEWRVNF